MDAPVALALGFSFLAVVLGAGCWFRGTPAFLRQAAQDALSARQKADAALESQAAFKVECQRILDAVADERAEASRLRARATAAQSRAEQVRAMTEETPQDRGSQLIQLRKQAGMI